MEICAAVVEEFDIWGCELRKLGVSRGLSWRDAAERGNQSPTMGMWCIETSERFGVRNTKQGVPQYLLSDLLHFHVIMQVFAAFIPNLEVPTLTLSRERWVVVYSLWIAAEEEGN